VRTNNVMISGKSIGLGQFLKLAGLVIGPADAKAMLEAGWIKVNSQVVSQLGRQLVPGDLVAAGNHSARVVIDDPGR
jgi:ribosome-associated protein